MFIQHLEQDRLINNGRPFILQDLGELGVFVDPIAVEEIETKVSEMLDANHFEDSGRR
jgi:hypothetical protein